MVNHVDGCNLVPRSPRRLRCGGHSAGVNHAACTPPDDLTHDATNSRDDNYHICMGARRIQKHPFHAATCKSSLVRRIWRGGPPGVVVVPRLASAFSVTAPPYNHFVRIESSGRILHLTRILISVFIRTIFLRIPKGLINLQRT